MPLARMARFLHENGIAPKAMGYAKMLDLLQDLPECLTLEKQPGGRDYAVHLHAFTRPKKDPKRRVLDEKEKERLRRIIQTNQKTSQFTGAQLCRWLQKRRAQPPVLRRFPVALTGRKTPRRIRRCFR